MENLISYFFHFPSIFLRNEYDNETDFAWKTHLNWTGNTVSRKINNYEN